MVLSAEKKKSLKALYETWGLDAVRKDLERNYHPSLVPTDISAFERAWVAAKESKGPRRKRFVVALQVMIFSLLAGIVVAIVVL